MFNKTVTGKDAATHCEICQFWIYVKFSKLSYVDSMVDTMIDTVFVNFYFQVEINASKKANESEFKDSCYEERNGIYPCSSTVGLKTL